MNISFKMIKTSVIICIFIGLVFSCSGHKVVDGSIERKRLTIVGSNEGLFSVDLAGKRTDLWTGGSVKKILSVPNEEDTWIILTSEGVLISKDLKNWEKRNNGLPEKTIKVYEDGTKSFLTMMQDIKDIAINPADSKVMVCATKDRIYLTRDQGQTWTDLGRLRYNANGIKAVTSAFLPELTVFVSHSLYGIHYLQPDLDNTWTFLNEGIENIETTTNPDEVSCFAVVQQGSKPEIFVSQTFRRRVYKLDWEQKKYIPVWSDGNPFGTVDSLYYSGGELYFVREGKIASINYSDFIEKDQPDITKAIRGASGDTQINCIVINAPQRIILNELWLLDEPRDYTAHIADGKEGIFIPIEQLRDRNALNTHINTIQRAGLNMIVIDGKDEMGRLRFTPNNPVLREMGTVFQPLDLETFIPEMKKHGIYTVARIVVFKDHQLVNKFGGKYAVWNARTSAPWIGTYANGSFYNERWLDPYSEEVWEYIALISIELYERGIDEIQFDYIRFPTDGFNLRDAHYRWQENDMDMESAILSFLRHVRLRVNAPISIDIYGANGWYRTGARTGQEVELITPWVDIICPMYYPSHFDQPFLAHNPPELRPWRIYYYGTLRTARISRGQVIIRSWTQAFFINVSYDREFYNKDYVRRQIEGVREAGTGGYTYWNSVGRYDDIPDK